MKFCSKCKEFRDESNFHKNVNNKDGLYCWCKPCVKVYNKKYNQANQEAIKNYGKVYSKIYDQKNYLHKTWINMIRRCTNSKHKNYKDYGGRGITVCQRWLDSFEDFKKDIGNRPTDKHTIDRIDNNGNYEPSNCKWSTMKEQNANKRNNS